MTESGKVFAVDIHHLAINAIRKKVDKMGLKNIIPILIDSYWTGIADASIDLVLLIDIIPVVRDHQSLFLEVFRVMKGKGRAYISHSHLSMAKTRKLVEGNGLFKISKCWSHDMIIEPLSGKPRVSHSL
ncbi:MAG: methyltransferase domain-containing protein [Dehalococcoidales bacterium]